MACGSAPGPAGGVTVGGGGRAAAGWLAGQAASDMAKFFSITITVEPTERRDQAAWIAKITDTVETNVSKNAAEGLLVQSVGGGGCLTLCRAILSAEAHDQDNLQRNLRIHHVNPGLPPVAGDGEVT